MSQGCQSGLYRAGDSDAGLAGKDAETARVFYSWNKWSRRWGHSGNLILTQVISFCVCLFCTFSPGLLQQSSGCWNNKPKTNLLLWIFTLLDCFSIMSEVYYSTITKMQITKPCINHIFPNTCGSILVWVSQSLYWLIIFCSLAHSSRPLWKLPFNASSTGKNGIEGIGIVSCAKRLGVNLVSVWQKPRRRRTLLTGAWERTLMKAHFIPPLLCPLECVDVYPCRGAVVFVPVLPLRFLNAAYQLTMATDRSLLIVAGLISRWCDSTLPVYYYKPESNRAGVITSKGTGSVNILTLRLCWVWDTLWGTRIDKDFYFILHILGFLISL